MASWAERHVVNRAVRSGVRLGRDIDGVRELEVAGRRTGRPRRVRVCNLRSRSTARLRFGRSVEDVVATEIPDDQKPPIARAYLDAATRPDTRRRLEWAAEGTPESEVRRGAASVPVFRLAAPDRLAG